jgi:O-antigen ligase
MTAKKHQAKPKVDWAELEETPWQVWGIRALSIAALATCLIADNGSPTVSSLSKVAFLQPLIGLTVALWVPLAIADRRYRPDWRHPLVIFVLVFCAALGLTVTTSVDPSRTFWSSIYRLAGVANYWHFAAWFLVLASTHRAWKDWRPLLNAANWIGMAVVMVGIYRYFVEDTGRLVSTIDNALYVAAFLLLQLFVALALLRASTTGAAKGWYAACTFMYALTLFMTGSRSATAAAALGLAVFGVAVILADRAKRIRRAVALTVLAAAVLAGLLWLRSSSGAALAGHLPSFAQRILLTTDFGSDRGSLAAIAWESFKDRPLLGWGLEHYEVAFERFYQPTGRDYQLAEPWYDRAHNQFAEFLATGGLVLFVAYVMLWAALFLMVVRRWRQHHEDGIDAAVLAGFIAYAAAMTFSFDMPGPMTVQWLLIALVGGLTMTRPAPTTKAPAAHLDLTIVLVVVVLAAESWWSLRPYAQAAAIERDCRMMFAQTDASIAEARDVLTKRNFATPELQFRFLTCGDTLMTYEKATADQKAKMGLAVVETMKEAAAWRPYDYKSLIAAGYAMQRYATYDVAYLDQAETVLLRAAELSPRRYRTYEQLGEIAIRREQYAKGASFMQTAYENTADHQERARLQMRAAWAAARAKEIDRSLMYIHLAAREPEASPTVDASVLAVLQEYWPEGKPLTPAVRDLANLSVKEFDNSDAYLIRYRLFVKSGEPVEAQAAAFEELRAKYPDVAAEEMPEAR